MKHHYIWLSLILSVLFFLSAASVKAQHLPHEPVKTTRSGVSVSGRVSDAQTGEPLAGASVYIADAKTGAITNANGSYMIRNIAAGNYLIEVSFVGYSSITEQVQLTGDLQKNFTLLPSVLESEGITVTGVSTATKIKRTPTPVTIMSKKELTQVAATNLIDALSKSPGIAQISTGPSISKPIIRGLGYNRVVVLNDGIRQEGQQWGDEHGIEIDEYSVQKVEILKGPASLIYGSDAMAGVINILTNVPAAEGTIKGSITGNYQTNNRLRGFGANLAGNKNGLNWNAYGSFKGAQDYKNKYDGYVFNSKFNEKNLGGYIGYNGSWGYSHLIVSSFNQEPGLIEGDRDA
ncbi:MAG TPA: TonB-dependent receptor plug domain-containing protein, partial [Agriterribacter sp.]|nr:TonB-dependent receptor plug domain-containing protein [Agriterribacter sp.]